MVRTTVLSLLLGALALIAGLSLFFSPPTATDQQVPVVALDGATAEVIVGAGTLSHGELQLELNTAGLSVVNLASVAIEAQTYPFLHLALDESPENLQLQITWSTDEATGSNHSYVVESKSRKSLWLATNELKGWTGNINSLGLVFAGRAGEVVRIRDFSLFPASLLRQLQAIYSDLTSYVPWNRAEMNSHSGVTRVSSFYPGPLIVAYLILSLFGYGLLLLVFRATLKFNWQVVALIFLACWVSLDMVWQNRLLHQLADTYRTFSGKNTQEKLAVGPDAHLYNFISQVIPLLEPKNARVFVHSKDEYRGQRSAYFLYPFNVYWPEPGLVFPGNFLLHSGDYIVLINPTTIQFNSNNNILSIPGRHGLATELVLSGRRGTVVRVN